MKDNRIFLLVGKSGSGKSYISQLLSRYGYSEIQSYTTRPPRTPNEIGHTFVNDEGFNALTDLVAYTEFDGYRYAATTQQVETHGVYVIDPAGVEYFKDHYHGKKTITVIYVKANGWTRFWRMIRRDGLLKAIHRMRNDRKAFNNDWLKRNCHRVLCNNVSDNVELQVANMILGYDLINSMKGYRRENRN